MNPLERISKWFTRRECTRSDNAARHGIENEPNAIQWQAIIYLMTNVMDRIRELCNAAIRPSSVFRNPKVNELAGGSENSDHMKGQACDFLPIGWTVRDTMKVIIANNIVFDQLIDEFGAWVHISVREKGVNRGQILQYRRVNGKVVKTYLTREQVLLAS